MFYSQTFLARKGPLGTVWCAAHLQHRLKKSHYTSTDIPTTVERIMGLEVPIALRMSGHLLLGVVRIYSKKVDYLFHDCKAVVSGLSKAFASIQLTLPEDARQAPVQSITLPDNFNLDAMNLEDDIYTEGSDDNHTRSQEEITLMEQIPTGREPFFAVNFDEVAMDTFHQEGTPGSRVTPMEEDICPPAPVGNSADHQDPGSEIPSVHPNSCNFEAVPDFGDHIGTSVQDEGPITTEVPNVGPVDDTCPLSFPDMEAPGILLDHNPDFPSGNFPHVSSPHGFDNIESTVLQDQNMRGKSIPSPDNLASGEQSLPHQKNSAPSIPAASVEAHEDSETHILLASAHHELKPSPPLQVPKRQIKKRKRQQFDEAPVLTNQFMKKSLKDSSNLLRKRRNTPHSALDMWRLNMHLRKEQAFVEPLITGLCSDLLNIYAEDYVRTKPHLVLLEQDSTGPMVPISSAPLNEAPEVNQSDHRIINDSDAEGLDPRIFSSSAPVAGALFEPSVSPALHTVPELDMDEILPLRDTVGHDKSSAFPEFIPSPDRFTPPRRDNLSPFSAKSLRSKSVSPTTNFTETTPNLAESTGYPAFEMVTPIRSPVEQADIPELINSAGAEDLNFLNADDNSPGSQGSQAVESLSVRTRAVAQYLIRHSPTDAGGEELSEDLNLNKILEGKTRKLCARMFYETLVLKSHGLVDVKQKEPYGDISLKLTSLLSKTQT